MTDTSASPDHPDQPVTQRYVLVAGATGRQGGAIARGLLRDGHSVRALTRNSGSPAALALAAIGVAIVEGDLNAPASLVDAVEGVSTVVLVSTPYEEGCDAEIRQGIALVDAATRAGIEHFVFNSVASADRETGVAHFDSKGVVERHLKSTGMPYTIVAPSAFVDDWLTDPDALADLQGGHLSMAMPPTRELQQISIAEVAAVSVLVAEQREPFLGQRIEIASDSVSGQQMAAIISRASNRKIEYCELSLVQAQESMGAELATMFAWFDTTGFDVEVDALRKRFPSVGWMTFEQWALAQDWSALNIANK
jgi:uncharacterized protein YbjT (DUF2867 family)